MPSLLPVLSVFQSTLPLRGATTYRQFHGRPYPISIHTPLAGSDRASSRFEVRRAYFNPHSPCGERLADSTPSKTSMTHFNPHSPCGERHDTVRHVDFINVISIHTPLAGSDALTRPTAACSYVISIHTPLAGSDLCAGELHTSRRDFNPHSPCGERLQSADARQHHVSISIHTPLAGSDRLHVGVEGEVSISIHTPLAGSDRRNETFLTK